MSKVTTLQQLRLQRCGPLVNNSPVQISILVELTKVKVILRPTIIRPVCPGVRPPYGPVTNFFFLLEFFLKQLRVCYFVTPSLTRGWVCNLLLLLSLVSAVPLRSDSRGTRDHILLSQFLRLSQPGGPCPRIYIPQEKSGSVISSATAYPFRRLLRLAGLWRRYSSLHTGWELTTCEICKHTAHILISVVFSKRVT
jgi:hypothetical protein